MARHTLRTVLCCCLFLALFADSSPGAAAPLAAGRGVPAPAAALPANPAQGPRGSQARTANSPPDLGGVQGPGAVSGSDSEVPSAVENAVVKVFATVRYPAPFRPWTKQAPRDITASGVVIGGDRILTNAHAVMFASDIQIQGSEADDKLPAHVAAVAPGIDLAVLKLDDRSFFATHAPIPRASTLPHIKDTVLTYGFPAGGQSLSITRGIVSRIEFVHYNYPVSGLRIQIDAAVNPGNSGGPAVADGRMIGLTFSRLNHADNIGYIIPDEEIELFLKDIADGRYDGKPAMYDSLQTLENPALRDFLGLGKSVEGVVVHQPYGTGSGYPLRQWDVITKIGATPIDDQGMIRLRPDLRVDFHYLVQKDARDGKVPLTIVRKGEPRQIELPVATDRPLLLGELRDRYPSYFIYGPLVFSRATPLFMSAFSRSARAMTALSAIRSPLVTEATAGPTPQRHELVVVAAPFFPSTLATGYGNPQNSVLYSVNGTHIRSLAQLVGLLRDLKSRFVTFTFDRVGGEALVFRRADMVAATQGILSDNDVRSQGSPDMMKIWGAKHGG